MAFHEIDGLQKKSYRLSRTSFQKNLCPATKLTFGTIARLRFRAIFLRSPRPDQTKIAGY